MRRGKINAGQKSPAGASLVSFTMNFQRRKKSLKRFAGNGVLLNMNPRRAVTLVCSLMAGAGAAKPAGSSARPAASAAGGTAIFQNVHPHPA
jgi:hypothetical protein